MNECKICNSPMYGAQNIVGDFCMTCKIYITPKEKKLTQHEKKKIPDAEGRVGCLGCGERIHPDLFPLINPNKKSKRCDLCLKKQKEKYELKKFPDKNGFIGCNQCGERLSYHLFPLSLTNPNKRAQSCFPCLDKINIKNELLITPFRTQQEEYKKNFPVCAISNLPIPENGGQWDHIDPTKKIKEVTNYVFWASLAGKTLDEKLTLHKQELEKCQYVTVAAHKKKTKEERGAPSQTPYAIKQQNIRKIIQEENWKYIQDVQNGLCGCGCGETLSLDQIIDFDHIPERGEKLFNIGNAGSYSQEKRTEERKKGLFLKYECHRVITEKRRMQQRNKRMKLFM